MDSVHRVVIGAGWGWHREQSSSLEHFHHFLSSPGSVSAVMIHGYIFHHFFDHVFGFSLSALRNSSYLFILKAGYGIPSSHSLVWMGRWLLNADEGWLLNVILFGWFLCLFLRVGSYACLLACFLLLHAVKIFWRGLEPCVILTWINVVKMSCVSRVSSHMTFIHSIPWHWLYQKASSFNDGHSKVAVHSDANILV